MYGALIIRFSVCSVLCGGMWQVGAEGEIVVGTATGCLTKATLVVFLVRTPGVVWLPGSVLHKNLGQKIFAGILEYDTSISLTSWEKS